MEYAKRDSNTPSELVALEYNLLEDKMKVLIEREGAEQENFYTRRKHEIEMKWLDERTLDPDRNYVWHANMPLPFWQSREIFEASKKMPRKSVISLIFPDYEMNASEQTLFDVLFEYGRAKGLEVVAGKLFEGAEAGDPRAVKMYLELQELIKKDDEDEDTRVRKLMRVSMNI